MANVNIPYGQAGLAAFEAGDTYSSVELFSGDTPVTTTSEKVQSGVAIPAFSVVARDAGGYIVLAQKGAAAPLGVPVGITTAEITAYTADHMAAVFRTGCFNPAALNWHASYVTDADKQFAFEGSKADGIFIRKFL